MEKEKRPYLKPAFKIHVVELESGILALSGVTIKDAQVYTDWETEDDTQSTDLSW